MYTIQKVDHGLKNMPSAIIHKIGLEIQKRAMVQGFETRDSTDIPVRALVESAKGRMWKKEKAVDLSLIHI